MRCFDWHHYASVVKNVEMSRDDLRATLSFFDAAATVNFAEVVDFETKAADGVSCYIDRVRNSNGDAVDCLVVRARNSLSGHRSNLLMVNSDYVLHEDGKPQWFVVGDTYRIPFRGKTRIKSVEFHYALVFMLTASGIEVRIPVHIGQRDNSSALSWKQLTRFLRRVHCTLTTLTGSAEWIQYVIIQGDVNRQYLLLPRPAHARRMPAWDSLLDTFGLFDDGNDGREAMAFIISRCRGQDFTVHTRCRTADANTTLARILHRAEGDILTDHSIVVQTCTRARGEWASWRLLRSTVLSSTAAVPAFPECHILCHASISYAGPMTMQTRWIPWAMKATKRSNAVVR